MASAIHISGEEAQELFKAILDWGVGTLWMFFTF